MLDQFKIYKDSFLMNKVRYISTIIIGLVCMAGAIIVPAIITAKMGFYIANLSQNVSGAYNYIISNSLEVENIVSDVRIVILILVTIVLITLNVLNVVLEKETYIAKTNMGKLRSDTCKEIIFKSVISSLIMIVLGLIVGIIVVDTYGSMQDIIIKASMQDCLIPSLVGLFVGGISSFVTFLLLIDKSREIKGF